MLGSPLLRPKPRVLVTGGAGFIGSHLVEALLKDEHEVCAIDNLATGRIGNLARPLAQPGFRFVRGSIDDQPTIDRLVAECDVVIHLAALVGVQLIVRRPVQAIETNVRGTECVLKAARRRDVRVLIASSSEVYGKGCQIPFKEDDDVLIGSTSKSRWSYAASKMIDEFLALAYQREYGLPVVCLRFFNTIGPRQSGSYGMVVPRFMRAALGNAPITVYGDGTQTRAFCDVGDTVRAIVALIRAPQVTGEVFNVGGDEEIAIRELAQRIVRLTGSNSTIRHVDYDDAYASGFEDLQRRVPDTSKLARAVGWHRLLSTDAALIRVRDWMMETGHARGERAPFAYSDECA